MTLRGRRADTFAEDTKLYKCHSHYNTTNSISESKGKVTSNHSPPLNPDPEVILPTKTPELQLVHELTLQLEGNIKLLIFFFFFILFYTNLYIKPIGKWPPR